MANGASIKHQHLKHKREAEAIAEPDVTVVVTQVVYADAQSTASSSDGTDAHETLSVLLEDGILNRVISSPVQSWTPVPTLVTSLTSSVATPVAVSSDSSSADASVTSSTVSASSTASASASGSSNDFTAGTAEYYAATGRGITYSPYSSDGTCKSTDEIVSDIQKLSAFPLIRLYAPDCNSVSAVLSAMGSNQKLFAGLFYMDSLDTDIQTLATQVKASTRGWDAVYVVSVGNEWVNSGTYSASKVVSAVNSARTTLKSAGWTGSVVTVDTVPAYENNPDLCTCSDFAAVNSHPFWDGNTAPEDSGSFLETVLSSVKNLCGKDVLITETGWPTKGNTYGSKGVPGTSQQLAALKSISSAVADNVIFFTTYNDLWKSPGDYGVEQYWGIFE